MGLMFAVEYRQRLDREPNGLKLTAMSIGDKRLRPTHLASCRTILSWCLCANEGDRGKTVAASKSSLG